MVRPDPLCFGMMVKTTAESSPKSAHSAGTGAVESGWRVICPGGLEVLEVRGPIETSPAFNHIFNPKRPTLTLSFALRSASCSLAN
jgi:hypothetical protein